MTHLSAPAGAWAPPPPSPSLGPGAPAPLNGLPCSLWADRAAAPPPAVELAASGRWRLERVDARGAGLGRPPPCRPAAVQEAEDGLSRTQEPRAFRTGGL